MFGASIFVGFYIVNGGQQFVTESLLGTGLGPYGILMIMMVLLVHWHVPGLGRHPAAGGSDFCSNYALPALGRRVWITFNRNRSQNGIHFHSDF